MPLDAIIRAHCSRKKGQGWAKNAGLTSEARLAIAIATAFLPVMMLSGRTCAAAALRAVLRRLPPLPRVASHRVAMGTLLSFSALFLSIYLVQLGSGSLGPLEIGRAHV